MISKYKKELIETARRFFEGINYTGIGSIEFKRDDRDGKFKMIELNPRIWAQNIQATAAGVNFSYIYYMDCSGNGVDKVLNFKENIRWLDLIQDFQSFIGNHKKGDIKFSEWIASIFGANCFAYFAGDDLKPGWKNSEYLKKYFKLPKKLIKSWKS